MKPPYEFIDNMTNDELNQHSKIAEYKKLRLQIRDLKSEAIAAEKRENLKNAFYGNLCFLAIGLIALLSLLKYLGV